MKIKNGTLFIGRKNIDNIQIGEKGLNNIQVGVIYEYKEYIFSSNSCYCAKLVTRGELETIVDGTKKHTETKIQELIDNGVLEEYIKEESEPKACMGCINSDICKHKSTVAKIEEQLEEDIKGAGISLQLICNRKRSLAPSPTIDTPYINSIGIDLCPRWDSACPNFHNGRCLSQLGCTKDIELLNK